MSGGLERAREDIAAGRLWKARDRLDGLRASSPQDQEVLELLGTVRYEMGDLPAAGLAWFLTEGAHPGREAALAAMHERYPTPEALAQALGRHRGGKPVPGLYEPAKRDAVLGIGCGTLALVATIVPWVIGIVWVLSELL